MPVCNAVVVGDTGARYHETSHLKGCCRGLPCAPIYASEHRFPFSPIVSIIDLHCLCDLETGRCVEIKAVTVLPIAPYLQDQKASGVLQPSKAYDKKRFV